MTKLSLDRSLTPAGFNPPRSRLPAQSRTTKITNFWKKNSALLCTPLFWNLLPRLAVARVRRQFVPSAILDQPGVMFVGTHHKAMTTYFHAVLRVLALALNIPFTRVNTEQPNSSACLILSTQSKIDLEKLESYRGVHVMRDPRDMIVSGYHYHKWTSETWVHRLDDKGQSYQEKLNTLDKKAGLFLEINHFVYFYRDSLLAWDIDDEDILEISYEALMDPNRKDLYVRIFEHLGFRGAELELGIDLMVLFSADNRRRGKDETKSKNSHLRSGRSGQWQDELEPEHLDYIERELGDVLEKFAYT